MPSMPPKDTSMLDWNRNTIKIRKNQTLFFFVSTNSKPDPYLGLKDHTEGKSIQFVIAKLDGVSFQKGKILAWMVFHLGPDWLT